MDHVVAERGARLLLPARREGVIPGASNLRLPRAVGERLARRAILSERGFEAGTLRAICSATRPSSRARSTPALAARVRALTSSGLVNAAANRRALRVGAELLETFRAYMATYCLERAPCHLSPALVRNLEEHWNARERSP